MKLIYSEKIEEIDTFESAFKYFYLNADNLILPIINIGISEHPLNPEKKMKYLDKCLLVFQEIITSLEPT